MTRITNRAVRGVLLVGSLALGACGSTSNLQNPEGKPRVVDLTPYSVLIVEDFADRATEKAQPAAQPLLKPKLDSATKLFPEQIASVVRAAGGFASVSRAGEADASTLILRGQILQYDEGNAALRWLVGFAAGNTNFDASLQLVDGGTGTELGAWKVDKNSWALGGGLAATQTPEAFMVEAAKKIGEELAARRKSGQITPPAASIPN